MGSTKTTVQSNTTPKPTDAEKQMQQLQLQQYKQLVKPQTALQLQGLDLIRQMFSGSTKLPGFFGSMGTGITPETLGLQAALMTKQNMPGFQQLGLGDSGVAFRETSKDIANNLLFPAEQFNIGAKQNLLNLALSGQAQVQQPITAQTGILSNQLQGLRSMNSTQTTKSNPFLNSFYGSLGQGLGGAIGGGISAIGGGFATPGGLFGSGGSFLCWVAREIFGSWEHPKTIAARFYITYFAPKWFRNFYAKYGQRIAKFIHNKPIFKIALRPLFEWFAYLGHKEVILCL